ncbi:EAL domain-containing protein [Desulfovibrio sulfodismutans]|uniref:EAL domain-containing protein n=1 Tax=Desulfolutivibrio sulfodismutans TaxID=63561 RepID=A0A7K3NTX4_9BACT|nr:bifunctional diguanylate cyclase/phosphodiesterase [Desulfolutivibrio sulfodismutans]NDY58709.1 EAL domain-containing protein [Desulfolutivibrio sulfodismutans]QLA12740.1 EAL domain-containing protein [Desulfolutivibrio sulfodismutans DSM 3696]
MTNPLSDPTDPAFLAPGGGESGAVFRTLFEGSPNAVALRDQTGRVLLVNQAFGRIFGYAAAESIGADLAELIMPGERAADDPAEWIECKADEHRETLRRRRDGSLVHVTMVCIPADGRRDSLPGDVFIIYRDITLRKQTEELLRGAERKFRSIFENAVEGIFQTTPAGRYLDVNPSLARIYGFDTPGELIEHFKDIKNQLYVDPGRRDDFVRIMDEYNEVWNFESRIRKKGGEIIWISENARAIFDEEGDIDHYEGTVVDVTERKRAEEALEAQRAYFRQLFENSPQAIILIDSNRNVLDANKGFEELFGYRAADMKGFGMRTFIVPEDLLAECENFRAAILSGNTVQRETYRRHRDGRLIPVSMIGFQVKSGEAAGGVVYIYQDISERKAFEEQITHQAFHDSLTHLPNRSLFAERLQRALARSRRRGDYQYAVLMIDLDKFKAVNDSMGHAAGDMLLVEIAARLKSCMRSVDTVARLGGDEFAVILEEFKIKREVLTVAERIQETLRRPCTICGNEVYPGASIGIVLRTKEYDSAEDVLRDADIAMYRAKETGKPYMIFDRRMHKEILEVISLEAELRDALSNDELVLHYQPIVNVDTRALEGFEALVRWNHPLKGIVPPDKFIPLAEETGIILPLGRWVIVEACRQLGKWQKTIPGAERLSVSVNVSCRQFVRDGLVEYVAQVLEETGIDPARLKLEITESVLMQDTSHSIHELNRLKALGVRIAVDDFGTGYSSLSYLRQLPIDHLKIDRSFISGSDNAEDNIQIVKSIISLARNLGLTVIAEGVEHEDQFARLQDVRCDKAQGYMFSRPVDSIAAERYILDYQRRLAEACSLGTPPA